MWSLLMCAFVSAPLWTVGRAHGGDQFALGPGGYAAYRDDGCFVVGRSNPKLDWPYVHPGPEDNWAGHRTHTFRVFFTIAQRPTTGECTLVLNLRDSHASNPPTVELALNGTKISTKALPPGGGDRSVFGDPSAGKPFAASVRFPVGKLRTGLNELSITTKSGSWFLYDSVSFEAPAGTVPAGPPESVAAIDDPSQAVFQKRGHPPTQGVGVRVWSRRAGKAVVFAAGKPVASIALKAGQNSFTASIPTPKASKAVQIRCEVDGRAGADRKVDFKPMRKWVLYILPQSHVDIGYTQRQSDVEKRQIGHIDEALRLAAKTRSYPEDARFKWNSEVLWAVDSYLRQGNPQKTKALVDAAKRGDIELEAFYGNELTGLCSQEELIRLTDFATSLRARYGLRIDSAMISDVPGWTWGVVPALAQSGVRYFSAGPNSGDRIGGILAKWGDKPFWWVGPSGKDRVLCWVAGGGYSSFHGQTLRQAGESWIAAYLGRLETNGYPYDMVQVRYSTGGDNGPPDATLSDYVREWNAKYAYPRIVVSGTHRMFDDFVKAYESKIPVAKGDLTPYWEDGAASSAWETVENRRSADSMVQSEALWAMSKPGGYPADAVAAAWRDVLLYDEHTWGAYNSISEPDNPFVIDQWKVKKSFADDAAARAASLRRQVAPVAGQARKVTVINTRSWPSTGVVTVDCAAGDRVMDAKGAVVPSQRTADGRLAILARDVPAFGAKTYSISNGKPAVFEGVTAGDATLIGPDLRIAVDPKTGAIVSLRSRSLGVDLANAKVGVNGYRYLLGANPRDLQTNGPVSVAVKESGPLVASLLIESDAPGCRKLTREVRITYGLDSIEVIDTIDKSPVREKEGVHLAFGFRVPNATTRVEVPWGVVRPETDQLPGSCKNWFSAHRWIDVSNSRFGVTVATPDAPLWEIGGITAVMLGSQTDPKAWIQNRRSSPELYAWVMNNHWHTNYRADQEGSTTFRFMIRPHGAFEPDSAVRFGMECAQPLVVSSAFYLSPDGPAVQLPQGPIVVSSLKPSRDGKATMVRLYNASDRPARTSPMYRARAKTWISDSSELRGKSAAAALRLPPWGVLTLRVE